MISLEIPFHNPETYLQLVHINPIRMGLARAGAAYLYQLDTNGSVTFVTKVTAPDKAVDDRFGWSVSQSGNILAVGATRSDPDGLHNAGAVYLYRLEANGSATYLTKVTAPDQTVYDNFGYSVSQYGNILAVGAFNSALDGVSKAGAAYLHQLESNGSVTFLTKVTAPDKGVEDHFGNFVSLSGNHCFPFWCAVGLILTGYKMRELLTSVSIGIEWIGQFLTKVTARDKVATDFSDGPSRSLGNILAVGAKYSSPDGVDRAGGAAYLYQLESNGSVSFLTKVTAPDKAVDDHFGKSVSQYGNLLVVGARKSDPDGVSEAGAIYLYQLEANRTVTYLTKLTAPDKAVNDQFTGFPFRNREIFLLSVHGFPIRMACPMRELPTHLIFPLISVQTTCPPISMLSHL